jgi:hypothetical protein
VNAVAEGTRLAGGEASRVQTGFLRAYALAIGASIAVLAVVFLAVR